MAKKKQPQQDYPSLFGDLLTEETKPVAKPERGDVVLDKHSLCAFNRKVEAEFSSCMIGYYKFVHQLPRDLQEEFLPYIQNVTSSIRFPIEEQSVKNGDKYLQDIFDDLLVKLGYNAEPL